jgi:hypothetical protein
MRGQLIVGARLAALLTDAVMDAAQAGSGVLSRRQDAYRNARTRLDQTKPI